MIEAQAKERGMILLNDIMPISDGQLFYTTGSSIAILYRPYEITTLSEPWPEFLIPIKKLKAYIDKSGALKRQLDAADKSGDDEPEAGYKEEEPAPAAENDKSEETSSENGGKYRMRCSCRVCGTYMVQIERGLESGCKCPDCGNECHDCMGSAQPPMSVEQLR